MALTESSPIVLRQNLALPKGPADRTLVWVRGEHDISTAPALSEALERAIALGEADLLVDMSGVTFMDASTIGVVLRACGQLRRRSRSLAVRSPSTSVRRVFELCQLADLFDQDPVDETRLRGVHTQTRPS
jgi:anti-sigma B factor antagonist